jgi:hypothetical protein
MNCHIRSFPRTRESRLCQIARTFNGQRLGSRVRGNERVVRLASFIRFLHRLEDGRERPYVPAISIEDAQPSQTKRDARNKSGHDKSIANPIVLYSRRSATSPTRWFSPLVRMRSARWRVGNMLSYRFTRLIRFQIEVAVATASASESVE